MPGASQCLTRLQGSIDDFYDSDDDANQDLFDDLLTSSLIDREPVSSLIEPGTVKSVAIPTATTVLSRPASPVSFTQSSDAGCSICFEDDVALVATGSHCAHRFCRDCLATHIRTHVGENMVDSVKQVEAFHQRNALVLDVKVFTGVRCPTRGCPSVITVDKIRELVDLPVFAKLSDFLFDRLMDVLRPDMTPCPTGCGGFLQENCQCTNADCRQRELTCQQRAENDWAVVKLSRTVDFHCCPHCRAPIEKNGGCDHMWCPRCRVTFNWSVSPRFNAQHRWFHVPDDAAKGRAPAQKQPVKRKARLPPLVI